MGRGDRHAPRTHRRGPNAYFSSISLRNPRGLERLAALREPWRALLARQPVWHFRSSERNRQKICIRTPAVSTTDPPRSGLRQVPADPLPQPLLPPSPRPRGRPPPGLHSGMGLLSMRRSWPRPKAVRRLHRTGGAPRSRRSHGRRSLQPPGSDVARLSAAIGAGGKPFGLSKLTFTRGRCRCEGATSYSLRAVHPA